MSSPIIWIGIPFILAVILWFIQRRENLVLGIAIAVTFLLSLLAGLLPIGKVINLGFTSFFVQESFAILGRHFLLANGNRSFILLIYAFGTFWFIGASNAHPHRFFIPLNLAIMAILVAALAVQPFLYAALLIEMAVLFSIPVLVPPGHDVNPGIFRYLIFQTMAMPFILIAGWAASGVEANPADKGLLFQAVAFLALGFAFWLAVFPFYSWLPMILSQSYPYVASFVVCMLSTVVFILALDFLNAFAWLREFQLLYTSLRLIGVIMVVTGGVWAAFQQNLARILGYAIIIESGFSLLALGIGNRAGMEIFVSLFPARLIAIGVWALALSLLSDEKLMEIKSVQGLLHRKPFLSGALLMSVFSLGGLPLLAIFPTRLYLLENLAQVSVVQVVWATLGGASLLVSGLRLLASMLNSESSEWKLEEKWSHILFFTGGMILLLILGIFPQWVLPLVNNMLSGFEHLF